MPASPRKNTAAKTTAPTAAEMAAQAAETVPAAEAAAKPAKAPKIDMSALAAGVEVAKELPSIVRESAASPFTPLIQKSWAEKAPMQTPPVPAENVTAVRVAIRRAATQLGLGVSLREVENADGTITVMFQAKQRNARKATPRTVLPDVRRSE